MIPTEKSKPQIDPTRLRILVYGAPKVGKSTFAIQNPGALVLDCDNNGTAYLECYRVPIFSWLDLKAALGELAKAEKHPFTTVVIDTVDGAYQFCRQHVCKEQRIDHESEDKFGRAWDLVKTEWMKAVTFIQSMGLGLWLISHADTKEVKIRGVKRQVTTLSLSGKTRQTIMALADEILYIDQDETGKRRLCVVPQDSLECGGRLAKYGLNQDIEFETESEAYQKFIGILKGELK